MSESKSVFGDKKVMDEFYGRILHMLRNVFIARDSDSYKTNGFVGIIQRSIFFPPMSSNLVWNKKALETSEIIADIALNRISALRGGDRSSFEEVITDFINSALWDEEIFDLNRRSYEKDQDFLFDLVAMQNPLKLAKKLWRKLFIALENSLTKWLVIYPASSISSPTFTSGFDGIVIYDPTDDESWRQIATNYENARFWHPAESQSPEPRRGEVREPIYNSKIHPNSSWIICETEGTSNGSRKIAAEKMRTFIAVLFSNLSLKTGILQKISARPQTYCKQFSSDTSNTGISEMNASIGEILPPIGNLKLSEEILKKTKGWYQRREVLDEEKRRRATVASQFFHYGLIADDIEQFIHFFIVMDALYGVRDDVRRTIIEGTRELFANDSMWKYKIDKLFDLRSSLVHGSCSSIASWDEFDAYIQHTKSHPLVDVAIAAMTALRKI